MTGGPSSSTVLRPFYQKKRQASHSYNWPKSRAAFLVSSIASQAHALYPLYEMSTVKRYLDTPIIWGLVSFVVGLVLGVNLVSVILLAIGLGGFLLYLRLHGEAEDSRETLLFASGPILIIAWMAGFVVRSLVF